MDRWAGDVLSYSKFVAFSSTFPVRNSLKRRALSIMKLSAPASVEEQYGGRGASLEISGFQSGLTKLG